MKSSVDFITSYFKLFMYEAVIITFLASHLINSKIITKVCTFSGLYFNDSTGYSYGYFCNRVKLNAFRDITVDRIG